MDNKEDQVSTQDEVSTQDQVSVQDQATEVVVESIVETKKETEHAKDCDCSTCLECLEWRK